MNITFISKKLEKLANNDRLLLKEYGKIMASKISLRLSQLRDADTLDRCKAFAWKISRIG